MACVRLSVRFSYRDFDRVEVRAIGVSQDTSLADNPVQPKSEGRHLQRFSLRRQAVQSGSRRQANQSGTRIAAAVYPRPSRGGRRIKVRFAERVTHSGGQRP